jgi:hypothetical protein
MDSSSGKPFLVSFARKIRDAGAEREDPKKQKCSRGAAEFLGTPISSSVWVRKSRRGNRRSQENPKAVPEYQNAHAVALR